MSVSIAGTNPPSSAAGAAAAGQRPMIRSILIACSGNAVEWFDFFAYAFTALYFAPAFFPSGDTTSQLLNTAGIFAAGFFMRPVGGWLFGRLADKRGRRASMIVSILLMCFGSLMIAVTPTYATIGILAPVSLAVARIIQGLSLGGEYGTSATYLTEMADARNRGFYSSFQYVTLIGGQICALLVLLVLQKVFLTAEQIHDWGWRVPFFIGALLAVIALIMRRIAATMPSAGKHSEVTDLSCGCCPHP
jgi:MHS family alpha-ketoglutarate permease-like MFS transporter